jgi:hypothetical protein
MPIAIDSTTVRAAQMALTARGFAVTMDGIFGSGTKRALEQFQQRENLPRTGELDAATLKALGLKEDRSKAVALDHLRALERAVAAGFATANQSALLANALITDVAGNHMLASAAPINLIRAVCDAMKREKLRWEAVRAATVRVAEDELQSTWNNGRNRETDAAMRPIIESYWRDGVYSGGTIPADIRIPKDAWSSAFIAWVVQQAGGGDRFSKVGDEENYRQGWRPRAHWRYVAPSKENRETNNGANPFWAFAITEEKPQPGDIVVKSREGSRATFAHFIERRTHGDVVVEVGANTVTAIGGNVGHSVSKSSIPLTADGHIASTGGGADDHFAIVRINVAMFDSVMCDLTGRGSPS